MYRYSFYIDNVRLPVSPKDAGKLKLVTEREKDQVFFRTKLSGSLVFKGPDFQKLLQVEQSEDRCLEIGFEIEKECAGLWVVTWKGYFSCNDVKWDLSRCSASVTPKPNDVYRAVLDNYGKEHNILTIQEKTAATLELDLEADFEFLTISQMDMLEREDADTWALFLYVRNLVITKRTHVYFRLKRQAPLVDGQAPELNGWSLLSTDATTAYYAKAPDLYNFRNYELRTIDHVENTPYSELISAVCGTPVPEGMVDVGCIPIYTAGAGRQFFWKFGSFLLNRNRSFNSVARYLIAQTAGSDLLPADNSTLSHFFNDATNYVTERPNTLANMQVGALSDIVGYNSTEPATRAEWSLKKLLDNLRKMFRVFWDIDNTGKIRIEHESYFQLQGIRDLTVHPTYLKGTDSYEYVKSEMPRYQRLLFQFANTEDFEKGQIEYGGVCVNTEEGHDTEEETVTDVTTDLEYTILSGGTTAQKGFVFLLVSEGMILKEQGDLTGQVFPNAGLSAANLVRDYYTHNRVLENGAVNRKLRTFRSVQKTKKQMALTIPACCDTINPYARFISGLGDDATLENMTLSLFPGTTAELTLLHTTTGKGPLTIGRQFTDQFDQSFS